MTTGGILDVIEGGKDRWLFNFDELTGKVDELAELDTTCFPRATFVGHGEFVAFGCRGSADKVDFAGFNLKGEQMWQQNFWTRLCRRRSRLRRRQGGSRWAGPLW